MNNIAFDIKRLKSIKLVGHKVGMRKGKPIYKFPMTRDKRGGSMDRFKREARGILDRGRDTGGVKGRTLQSPNFNEDAWVASFIKLRVSEMPKNRVGLVA